MEAWHKFVSEELLNDFESAQTQIKEKINTKNEEYAEVIQSIINKFGIKQNLQTKI